MSSLSNLPSYTKKSGSAINLHYCVYDRQWEKDIEETNTEKILYAINELFKNGQREIVVKISDNVKAILYSYIKRNSPFDSRVFGYLQKRIGERIPELELCQIEFEIDVPNDVSDRDLYADGGEKSAFLFKVISCRTDVDYDVMVIRWG